MLRLKISNTLELFREILKSVAPPPNITVSEWADNYRKLSMETSAEPGKWRTDRAPYQREIMDSLNDPEIETTSIMSCSQVGKSELLLNAIGYYIDTDPGPMLLVQPTETNAKDFSKERIAPMIRDTQALREKVSDSKSRDSDNTILNKKFPGGHLALIGANAASGLASRPIRIILADEIDRYPEEAGSEGDPLSLAEKRTSNFWNKKKFYVSTPVIEGQSRIEFEYKKGTQEEWKKKCPNCGEYQFINLKNMKFEHKKDEKGNYTVWDIGFQCSDCGFKYDEYEWKQQPGKWVAKNPGVKGIRSFHLNKFVSPWVSWEEIILEWLSVKKDPAKYKVFKNTVLGLPWKEVGEIENEDFLLERREEYEADLPEGVLVLTAGVDVQDNRLEYEIVGWGHGEESWGIEYGKIFGSPDKMEVWETLLGKLEKTYKFKSGKGLKIACTCVDSGGHFTSEVYEFTKANERRRIFAIKGKGGIGYSLLHTWSRTKKENALLVTLGVDDGKSTIYSRLKKVKEPGGGYFHFPSNKEKGYDRSYFQGLISEKKVTKKKSGQYIKVWEQINENKPNEPLDLRNYAYAALKLINPSFEVFEKKLKDGNVSASDTSEKTKKKPRRRRGVVNKGVKIR